MGRRKVLFAVLIGVILIGLVGCAGKGQKAENRSAVVTPEAKSVTPKGWNTYYSKAGFFVSYPKEWYLEENIGTGWRVGQGGPAFTIANQNPSYYIPREGDSVEMFFDSFDANSIHPNVGGVFDDDRGVYVRQGPPPESDLAYYGKALMRTVERINIFKKRSVTYCLTYGQPGGYTEKHESLFFYLPKLKKIASVIIFASGKYSIDELLDKVIIQVGD